MAASEPGRSLRRAMGFRDVALFLVVAVVGPRWIATAAAAGPAALLVWAAACVALFVPLAFTVLELSSRYPLEGGFYVWTRRAFGDFVGFMTAWTYWTSNLVYFPGLLYFAAGSAVFVAGPAGRALSESPTYFMVASLAGLGLAFALNLVGLEVGKRLHNAGAVGTWIPVALLVAMGAWAAVRLGPANAFTAATLLPGGRLRDLVFASTIAFAFTGLEAAPLMAGEISDPRRTLPRAVIAAGAVITGIYLLGTLAVLLALPAQVVSGLQGIMQAIESVAARVGVPWLTPLAAGLLVLGSLGGVGAWLASVARLPFVAGVDRFLPEAFGRVHPRWGTPHVALVTQVCGAGLFVLMGQAGATVKGAYDALVAMAVIATFLPYLALFAAMIKLQREPAGPEVVRVPGGTPVAILLAALGLATTLVAIALALLPPADAPRPGWAVAKVVGGSLALVALGVGLYAGGRRRRAAAGVERPGPDTAPRLTRGSAP